MWARVENNIVVEVTEIDPDGRFHPSLIWLECQDEVTPGYRYDEGKFIPEEE